MMTRMRPKMSRYLMGITYLRGNIRTVEERRRSGIGLCRGEAAARREHQSVSNLDDRVSWISGGSVRTSTVDCETWRGHGLSFGIGS